MAEENVERFIIEAGFTPRPERAGAALRFKDQFVYMLNLGLVQVNSDGGTTSCDPQWFTCLLGSKEVEFRVFNLTPGISVAGFRFEASFNKPEDTASKLSPFADGSLKLPLRTAQDYHFTPPDANCEATPDPAQTSYVFGGSFPCWTITRKDGGKFILKSAGGKYVMSIGVEVKQDPDIWKFFYCDPEIEVGPYP